MTTADYPHRELTQQITAGAFRVSNALGCGFLEKVYENAMVVELKRRGLEIAQQVPLRIVHLSETVGDYVADLVVAGPCSSRSRRPSSITTSTWPKH